MVVLAAIVTLAGCTSGSSSSSDTGGDEAGSAGAAQTVAAAQAAPDQFGAPAPAAESADGSAGRDAATGAKQLATVPVDGSKVIKTADLAVRLVVAPVPATEDTAADATANGAARAAAIATATTSVRGSQRRPAGFSPAPKGADHR